MRTFTDDDLLALARKVQLVTTVTKMDGSETFNIVDPNANTWCVLNFARRLLEQREAPDA